jgi:hypothetical protein
MCSMGTVAADCGDLPREDYQRILANDRPTEKEKDNEDD